MPKVDYRRYSLAQREHCRNLFIHTLLRFDLSDSGQEFLQDLLTESEITMFARRIEIAKRLLRGWSFERIMKKLHVGQRTVIAVDQWLEQKLRGYRAELCPPGRRSPSSRYAFTWLQKQYSHHQLLLSILLSDSPSA